MVFGRKSFGIHFDILAIGVQFFDGLVRPLDVSINRVAVALGGVT